MQAKTFVKSLRGSSGQILWAFYFAWRAMDVDEVIGWTGLKRETCYSALKSLECDFLGTQTLAHGRKVWFLNSEMLPILRDLAVRAGNIQVIDANSEKSTDLVDVSVKRTPEDIIIINSTYLNDSVNNNNNKGQESVKRTPGESDALSSAFSEFKIVGKKKDELCGLDWVNAEYVRASVEYSKAEGRGEYAVGMAITRMIAHSPQPTRRKNGHIENCNCAKCQVEDAFGKYSVCPDCNTYPCQCDDEEGGDE